MGCAVLNLVVRPGCPRGARVVQARRSPAIAPVCVPPVFCAAPPISALALLHLIAVYMLKRPASPGKRGTPRVNRACDACRRQKTRCFLLPNGCLRCALLQLPCSLAPPSPQTLPLPLLSSSLSAPPSSAPPPPLPVDLTPDQRIQSIQHDVREILTILQLTSTPIPAALPAPSATPAAAPLPSTVALLARETHVAGLPWFAPPSPPPLPDCVSMGILMEEQVVQLVQIFRDRYGRWVLFPDKASTHDLVAHIRRTSLLFLSVCCCLALRYLDPAFKIQVYERVVEKLRIDLADALLTRPQQIEFVQALVVLALYGWSLSSPTLAIDGWYLLGIGLMTAMNMQHPLPPGTSESPEYTLLTVFRLINYLLLTHLSLSNHLARSLVVPLPTLRSHLDSLSTHAGTNNFDARMVLEVSLQIIVYQFLTSDLQASMARLPTAKEALAEWHRRWVRVLDQPASNFVVTSYHYSNLMVLYGWGLVGGSKESGSPEMAPQALGLRLPPSMRLVEPEAPLPDASQDPLHMDTALSHSPLLSLRLMVYHADKVVTEMLRVQNDSYFAFLSDLLHFSAVFLAVLLVRVLAWARHSGRHVDFSSGEEAAYVSRAMRLSQRFAKVASADGDVVVKYAAIIDEVVRERFPEYAVTWDV